MEQIDQLARAGQYQEALQNLERLVSGSEGRLVELGEVQHAATLSVQVHGSLQRWAQLRTFGWSRANSPAANAALQSQANNSKAVLDEMQSVLDPFLIQRALDRYALSPVNIVTRLRLCDLYMDRGWTIAARQALHVPGLTMRIAVRARDRGNNAESLGMPWPIVWTHLRKNANALELLREGLNSLMESSDMPRAQIAAEYVSRLAAIAALEGDKLEFEQLLDWAQACCDVLPESNRAELQQRLQTSRRWYEERQKQIQSDVMETWNCFAGNDARANRSASEFQIDNWPSWTRPLERMTGSTDRNPASKPPVAENTLGLIGYHPLVDGSRVYVNELTRIVAYDLEKGTEWPATNPPLPLFDSGMSAVNYLPLGYATMGAPRGTLLLKDNVIYGRQGPPVTGWFGRAPTQSDESLSYIVALDLGKQGSMRPGFPLHLNRENIPGGEFEGCPSVVGDRLLVAISQRDNVNLRRSVAAFHKGTGQLLWRSPVLASGTVSGSEQASLLSHQLLTVSGGRVLINTNLGSVACVDLNDGQIVWLARYRRSTAAVDQPYALQDRYRYRDLNPCVIDGSLLICAPQDCPEVFALDVTSGDLIWSTDAERADETTQILGARDQSVILSGDRIVWLDRNDGRVIASFPAATTEGLNNSLPAPRGIGRGVLSGDKVYWPTQNEIFVFDADQARYAQDGNPKIRDRIQLNTRGAEGGNMVLFKDGLLIASASRLFVFKR